MTDGLVDDQNGLGVALTLLGTDNLLMGTQMPSNVASNSGQFHEQRLDNCTQAHTLDHPGLHSLVAYHLSTLLLVL